MDSDKPSFEKAKPEHQSAARHMKHGLRFRRVVDKGKSTLAAV